MHAELRTPVLGEGPVEEIAPCACTMRVGIFRMSGNIYLTCGRCRAHCLDFDLDRYVSWESRLGSALRIIGPLVRICRASSPVAIATLRNMSVRLRTGQHIIECGSRVGVARVLAGGRLA